jgi:hypothetical protein
LQTLKMESAMGEQINEQAEKMREMAQTTLDKAKEAVSKYMTESQKLREKADSGISRDLSKREGNERKGNGFRGRKCSGGIRACAAAVARKRPAGNGYGLSTPSQGTDGKDERADS